MIRITLKKNLPAYPDKFPGKEFEVNNWDLSAFILQKIVPVSETRLFPLNEIMLMAAAVAWTKPTHIFDWGTNTGKSARIFFETCSYLKLNTEIHSIDLPDEVDHVEHPHQKRGKLVKGKKNVFLHQGDGVELSLKIYESLNSEARPLFFLDGDHSYETVCRELTAIISRVKNPAILLHDTFYQTEESKYNIGPYKAIEDITAQFPHIRFKRKTVNTGLPGMTFLYI